MRRLFLVIAKLVGILQLNWALVNFIQIGFAISMMGRTEPTNIGQIVISLLGIGTYLLLSLGMTWILLARTEWLADKLKIQDGTDISGFYKHPLLTVGVILIGVYISVHAIPSLARAIIESHRLWEGQLSLHAWNRIIPSSLQLGLGVYLALKAEKVAGLLTKRNGLAEQAVRPYGSPEAGSPSGQP